MNQLLFDVSTETEREDTKPSKRKSPAGESSSNLICSAYIGNNEDVFPSILELHVPEQSLIADVTYGKGVFWKNVDLSKYELLASDLQTGTDLRILPYEANSLDCLVLDPPYMEGLFRRAGTTMAGVGTYHSFREHYSDQMPVTDSDAPKYHEAVLDLYVKGAQEAYRTLKNKGVFIVKCQDEVSANKQRLTHVELINAFESMGFYAKDLFVVVRSNKPGVSRIIKQQHARKNHSYFLVFIKK